MDLGSAIRALRKAHNIKKKDLADQAGLSTTALYNIEHNISFPTKDTIANICTAMDIPVSYLMLFCVTEEDVPEEKRLSFRYLITPLKLLLIQDRVDGTEAELKCRNCIHYDSRFWCNLHRCHSDGSAEICNDFVRVNNKNLL